jgi:hypothetical protein
MFETPQIGGLELVGTGCVYVLALISTRVYAMDAINVW